jgi:hypothetical protein
MCPKHDLALDAVGPRELPHVAEGGPIRWVTVGQFRDSEAAEIPRIRLEAEGIPTFVDGERMGSRSMYEVATGGVRLAVPDTLASEARIILSQTWSATVAELDIEEVPEEDDEPYPPPSSSAPLEDSSSLRYSLLIFVAVGLPSLFLAYLLIRYLY